MIQSSPRFSARARRPAPSEPPAGSENSWHQIFSPEASGGKYLRLSSSPANAIMVGPHMPWPMMNIELSLPKAPSSCCQITRSIGVAPRPPYSFGQCRQAHPASAFFFCQAFATSRMLAPFNWVRPSEDFFSSSSYCFGALAAIQAFASARNAASCGVSSKFITALFPLAFPGCCAALLRCAADPGSINVGALWVPAPRSSAKSAAPRPRELLRRIPLAHAVDQRVFPVRETAERQRHRVRTPIIHVAVKLPRTTHAAIDRAVDLGPSLQPPPP